MPPKIIDAKGLKCSLSWLPIVDMFRSFSACVFHEFNVTIGIPSLSVTGVNGTVFDCSFCSRGRIPSGPAFVISKLSDLRVRNAGATDAAARMQCC